MAHEHKKTFGIKRTFESERSSEFKDARETLIDATYNILTEAAATADAQKPLQNQMRIHDHRQRLGRITMGEKMLWIERTQRDAKLTPADVLEGAFYSDRNGRSTFELHEPTAGGGWKQIIVSADHLELLAHTDGFSEAESTDRVIGFQEITTNQSGDRDFFSYYVTRSGSVWTERVVESSGIIRQERVEDPQVIREAALAIEATQSQIFPRD
jgi:hypothetical protein